ncbi:interferon-induced very large GTPase 1-like [Centropristis striata]|uniref:interferon-induced very large GTPase 1-like n=1 Tax=Centropristis striata TaxID=184440 RepID=UPI0027DEC374|nr:interferon-induced very large GTPase 1-like [Centropristis striata]
MEEDKDDNTAAAEGGGGDSGTKSVTPIDKDPAVEEMEGGADTTKCDTEPGEAQQSEKTAESTGGDSEITCVEPSASDKTDESTGEGDDGEELQQRRQTRKRGVENNSKWSSEESETMEETSATSQSDSSALQQNHTDDPVVEDMGENTAEIKCDPVHEPGEAQQSEKTAETTGGDSEITCVEPSASDTTDESTGEGDDGEELQQRRQKRKRGVENNSEWSSEESETMEVTSATSQSDSSALQQNHTDDPVVEDMGENTAEIKCDPVHEPAEAQQSEKTAESTEGDSEITCVVPSASDKTDESTGEGDDGEELQQRRQKRKRGVENNSEWSSEESETMKVTSATSQSDSSVLQQNQTDDPVVEDMGENTAEIKCDPVHEPGEAQQSEKTAESTGGDSEITCVEPSASDKTDESTGEGDDGEELQQRRQKRKRGVENNSEWSSEESETMEVTSATSQSDSSALQQNQTVEDTVENTAEIRCDPVHEPGEAQQSEKTAESTEGDSKITCVEPSASDKTDESTGEGDDGEELQQRGQKRKRGVENNSGWSSEESETMEVTSATSQSDSSALQQNHTGILDMDGSGNKDEQSVKISEDIDRNKQHQRETEKLLSRLHLQDKHQQKLSATDFLTMGPPVKHDHNISEKDLAHSFLQKLMMLDYRARYIPVTHEIPDTSHYNPCPEFDTLDTDDNDLDGLFSTSVEVDQSRLKTHVHPMDVQMAVFHCSDSFLKQDMITKLSQCQYALPLLVPDPVTMNIDCPLWTFRQIKKTWKKTEIKENSNTVTMKSMSICKAETAMVSFLRLGSLSVSKSQLMNTLINDRHSTFFHRNCPGSTKSRHLMDGVAEIAWYCPAGKPNDAFTDCIAFCNLHGDALTIEKQRDILTDKSSVNVVLVPTLQKGDKSTAVISALYKSPKPLILLIADNDHGVIQLKEGKYKIGLKDRSQSDVSEELKIIIRGSLSGPHESFQLETMAEVSGIRVDEDDKLCQNGKSAAMKIVNLFQSKDVSEIKETFLPCQGKLWHDWSSKNKELYHLKGHIEKEKCQKQQQLKQIRQKQCTASCGKLMKLFIENLSLLPSTDKEYFLKWTQILIDALSTDDLSLILQSYDEKWSEVLELKKKHDKTDLKEKQTELEKISTKLQSATFGLEHIFREMGQIYEAHASLQKQTKRGKTDWSKYPELAAELMISGHPMELMDGDAGHVPLTWISSLLDEVIKKLGDKRVFVLSVLGVQSSGKSTMLNAMFGLQFAVSAGRCTKGAFMQLVKVSEEIKKDFQFDYILVVDTEGLHPPELAGNDTIHHDNELATFVVGLGNMTLININGENPAEMQDVLQIVVQAFMRMKKIKLSPSCVFVHQNVTDIAAAERVMHGKRQLQEKLDQMAQLAAKEEVCDAECFSDIIAFDVQKDVKYFAQLWEGSPPMAPPNPGYSESIQELKSIICSKALQSVESTLSQFKSKIHDLWNALLNENFVFSFKNTLEIAVYRKLEVQYGNWTWALRSNMLSIENKLYTKIENGKLDKFELDYLHKEMKTTYVEIKKAMTAYFDDDRDKEILVQWRHRFQSKIQEFYDEHLKGVKRQLDEVIEQKNACKKLDDKKTEFQNKLLQKSKELAHQLKDKAEDEEELENHFNSVWSGWVHELTADTKPIEDINYDKDQSTILHELGFEWSLIHESKSSGRYKKISRVGDYLHYATLTRNRDLCNTDQQLQETEKERQTTGTRMLRSTVNRVFEFVSETVTRAGFYLGYVQYEEQQLIRFFINDIEKKSLNAIKSKPVATRGYRSTYLQKVANSIKENVTEFESKRTFALKKEFTVDLLLYVFHRAGKWLTESHKKFQGNNDALAYVESKKMQYYKVFRSFCKENSSAVVLGELICEKLKSSTVEAVCNKTAIDLAREMKCNIPAFNGNRLNLEKHLLKSLAEKEDFDSFITYIHDPRNQAESFISKEVQKYIFTENKDKAMNILKKNVEDIRKHVSQALFDATKKVQNKENDEGKKADTDIWVDEFSSLLKDELTFDTICCQNFSDITDFNFLREETERGLVSIIDEISSLSLDKMEEFRMKPDEILIDQLCNCCWVKCPFCSAVCTNTLKDHSPDKHNVPFHRPSGTQGFHTRGTVDLVVDFCTTLVASDGGFHPNQSDESFPYKQFQSAGGEFATWEITPDASKLTYWKWFVCRFQKQLEEYYQKKFQDRGEIPSEWRNHNKEEAIESLDDMYNL